MCAVSECPDLTRFDLTRCLYCIECLRSDSLLTCPRLGSTMCEHFGAVSTIARVQWISADQGFVRIQNGRSWCRVDKFILRFLSSFCFRRFFIFLLVALQILTMCQRYCISNHISPILSVRHRCGIPVIIHTRQHWGIRFLIINYH